MTVIQLKWSILLGVIVGWILIIHAYNGRWMVKIIVFYYQFSSINRRALR